MRASRRLIHIYTASTFTVRHNDDGVDPSCGSCEKVSSTYSSSSSCDDGTSPGHTTHAQTTPGNTLPGHQSEGQQSFECQLAMHRALLEESLKVGAHRTTCCYLLKGKHTHSDRKQNYSLISTTRDNKDSYFQCLVILTPYLFTIVISYKSHSMIICCRLSGINDVD